MRFLLSFSLVVFISSSSFIYGEENSISDEKISQITQRLESYNTDSLIERRDFLVSYQESGGANQGAPTAAAAATPTPTPTSTLTLTSIPNSNSDPNSNPNINPKIKH